MHSAGYIISAIFICAEYQRLGIFFREYRILRASFWIKLTFIIVEIALAIAFGVTQYRTADNSAAIIEWIIALMYIFYTWSKFARPSLSTCTSLAVQCACALD